MMTMAQQSYFVPRGPQGDRKSKQARTKKHNKTTCLIIYCDHGMAQSPRRRLGHGATTA